MNSAISPVDMSVILYNRDNGLYLEKSMMSVLAQGVPAIELIVVDDASSDSSVEIMAAVAARDGRVQAISLPSPVGLAAARKLAVERTSGAGVMFLESCDFYAPNACATVLESLRDGNDLVRFDTSFLLAPGIPAEKAASWEKMCNGGEPGVYGADAIKYFLLRNGNAYSKISFHGCAGEVARKAYRALAGHIPDNEADARELETLAREASSLRKLPNCLYNFRIFQDISERKASFSEDNEKTPHALEDMAAVRDMRQNPRQQAISAALQTWLRDADAAGTAAMFNRIASRYGIMQVMQVMWEEYREAWGEIAARMRDYQRISLDRPPRRIGLYYGQLRYGGTERVVFDLTDLLIAAGYEVVIFLWSSRERDLEVNPAAKIVYAPKRSADAKYSDSLRALCRGAMAEKIDVMIFQDPWSAEILWETIPLRYLGIATLMIHHFDFILPLLYPTSKYDLQENAATFRCLDKLICLSPQAELYFRACGINAQYIHNPIKAASLPIPSRKERKNQVIVVGRMDAPIKRMEQCLYTMAEVVREIPDASMVFVGNFNDENNEYCFLDLAMDLGIRDNIIMTGWCPDPHRHIAESALLLSTSYGEGFPLGVGEAQALGLPCVIYDLPLAAAIGNESIITVPQGNYRDAAREIIKLLQDEERWNHLSAVAIEHTRAFSPEAYIGQIGELLNTFERQSSVSFYKPDLYRSVLTTLGFYGAQLPPWV